jgi:intracellular sulfur oxidation DsrE/DsrF family protein
MKAKFTDWLNPEKVKELQQKEAKIQLKIKTFETFVKKLLTSYPHETNDFGKLKMQCLLFFLCNASIKEDKKESLYNVFDNWHVVPYGYVEADINQYIKENNGEFSFFTINRFCITLTNKNQ